MISPEAIVVVVGWLVSLGVALFVVPKLAADRTLKKFGLPGIDIVFKSNVSLGRITVHLSKSRCFG